MKSDKTIKVLCFDSWTVGSYHYVRLIEEFKKNHIEMLLLHLESWGGQKTAIGQDIDGLKTRDISYYRGKSFSQILDTEQPDLVLFLSTETFAHRAFQRLCHFKRIPTINLYHAVIGVLPFDGQVLHEFNLFGHFKNIARHFRKTVLNAIPAYAASLITTSAGVNDWSRLIKDLYYRAIGKWIFNPARDATSTKTCVYTDVDRQNAIDKYGHAEADVVTVGNPDLIRFGLTEDLIGSGLKTIDAGHKQIIYIDSGISSHGWVFNSDHDYLKHLVHCAEMIAHQGLQVAFKLKPHPEARKNYLSSELAKRNIKTIENDDFISELSSSVACMIEPTTLGLIPAILGLPLFLVHAAPLESVAYGDVYLTYPRSMVLNDLGDVQRLLNDENRLCDPEEVRDWIKNNSGPLPASEMPSRVAKVVLAALSLSPNDGSNPTIA